MSSTPNTDMQNKLYKIAGVLFIVAFVIGSLSGHVATFVVFLPLGVVFLGLGMARKTK